MRQAFLVGVVGLLMLVQGCGVKKMEPKQVGQNEVETNKPAKKVERPNKPTKKAERPKTPLKPPTPLEAAKKAYAKLGFQYSKQTRGTRIPHWFRFSPC